MIILLLYIKIMTQRLHHAHAPQIKVRRRQLWLCDEPSAPLPTPFQRYDTLCVSSLTAFEAWNTSAVSRRHIYQSYAHTLPAASRRQSEWFPLTGDVGSSAASCSDARLPSGVRSKDDVFSLVSFSEKHASHLEFCRLGLSKSVTQKTKNLSFKTFSFFFFFDSVEISCCSYRILLMCLWLVGDGKIKTNFLH